MPAWPYGTKTWKRLRFAKLSASPLCEDCAKRGVDRPAQHVDHVLAIAKGGEPFPALDGLAALCASCHSIKTAALDRAGGSGLRKGCAADGTPLDALHPFNAPTTGGPLNREDGSEPEPMPKTPVELDGIGGGAEDVLEYFRRPERLLGLYHDGGAAEIVSGAGEGGDGA